MNIPYSQSSGNISFVPILHLRLSGAVLVQRALSRLEGQSGHPFDDQDLIAVGLPESVRAKLLQGIVQLPTLSQIVAAFPESKYQEVFPVTPCDGVVEAVRIATERSLPLKFIDREVVPGHLAGRGCVENPDFPDDWLALSLGAEKYLALAMPFLAQPPARKEPVDTWRETHMAAQLRRLQPRYRRILVVSDATHVEPIRKLLADGSQDVDLGEKPNTAPKFHIARPNLKLGAAPKYPRSLTYVPRRQIHDRSCNINRIMDAVAGAGRLDVLVNLAGTAGDPARDNILNITAPEFRALIDSNLTAPTLVTQAALRRFMVPQRSGIIFFLGTLSTEWGIWGQMGYHAGKFGLHAVVKHIIALCSRHNIRTHLVRPGIIATRSCAFRPCSQKYAEPRT